MQDPIRSEDIGRFMTDRSHPAKTAAVEGASHAPMVPLPEDVACLIEEAASLQ